MFTFLRRLLFGRRPTSIESRYTWWQLVNWDEVGPQVWYVEGEVVEA
jgi:hypothetical protein